MAERWDTWPTPVSSSKHTGQMLDWIRWKTGRKALVVVAIGVNSVVVAKDPDLSSKDAIEALQTERDLIDKLLNHLTADRTHAAAMRPNR